MDYSVAKAGLASFCKALSKEVGPQGIRVNTVSPGPVATDLWLGEGGVAQTVSAATGAAPQEVASQVVTGRFTSPDEVADLAQGFGQSRTATFMPGCRIGTLRAGQVTGKIIAAGGSRIPLTGQSAGNN